MEKPPRPGWLNRVFAPLTDRNSYVRRRIRRRALAFPWYRTRRQTEVLAELAELFRKEQTPCAIVGGFAISGLSGRTSGVHGDIDIAFLDRDRNAVFATLRGAGFRLWSKNPCSTGATRNGFQLDLFHWRDAGDGNILHVTADIGVLMPETFLTETQAVNLNGTSFRVPSTEYMVATLPFVQRPETRRFLQSLAASLPLQTEVGRKQLAFTLDVTLHESRMRPGL